MRLPPHPHPLPNPALQLLADHGVYEVTLPGFCNLLRDCRLLDSSFGWLEVDVIFTRVEAGPAATSIPADMHVDWREFKRCLAHVALRRGVPMPGLPLVSRTWDADGNMSARRYKSSPTNTDLPHPNPRGSPALAPQASSSSPMAERDQQAYKAICRHFILPFAKKEKQMETGAQGLNEGLFTRTAMVSQRPCQPSQRRRCITAAPFPPKADRYMLRSTLLPGSSRAPAPQTTATPTPRGLVRGVCVPDST